MDRWFPTAVRLVLVGSIAAAGVVVHASVANGDRVDYWWDSLGPGIGVGYVLVLVLVAMPYWLPSLRRERNYDLAIAGAMLVVGGIYWLLVAVDGNGILFEAKVNEHESDPAVWVVLGLSFPIVTGLLAGVRALAPWRSHAPGAVSLEGVGDTRGNGSSLDYRTPAPRRLGNPTPAEPRRLVANFQARDPDPRAISRRRVPSGKGVPAGALRFGPPVPPILAGFFSRRPPLQWAT